MVPTLCEWAGREAASTVGGEHRRSGGYAHMRADHQVPGRRSGWGVAPPLRPS